MAEPFFLEITIKNMLSVRDSTVDLSRYKVVGIVGEVDGDPDKSNGAGKTSIGECILLAWFGRGRADIFNSIKDDAEEGEIELKWQNHEGGKMKQYRVLRRANNKTRTHIRELYIGKSTKPFGGGKTATDKHIEELLGIDFKTIIVTNYFMQKKDDAFTVAPAGERKTYLKNIIGTVLYDLAKKEMGVQVTALEKSLATSQTKRQALFDEVTQLKNQDYAKLAEDAQDNLKKCTETIEYYDNLKSTADTELTKLETAEQTYNTQATLVGTIKSRVDSINKSIPTMKQDIIDQNNKMAAVNNARIELENMTIPVLDSVAHNAVTTSITNLTGEKGSITAEQKLCSKMNLDLQKLDQKCPTCHEVVAPARIQSIIETNTKRIDTLTARMVAIDEQLIGLNKQVTDFAAIQTSINACNVRTAELNTTIKEEITIGAKLEAVKGTLEKLEAEKTTVDAQYTEEFAKLQALPRVEQGSYDSYKKQVDECDTKLTETRGIEQQYHTYLGNLQAQQARIPVLEQSIADIDAATADTAHQIKIKTILYEAYSTNGIPSLIVDNMFPLVQDTANQILADVRETRRVEFSSVKEKVGGGFKESLEVWIHNLIKDTKRLYETYSGGESTFINIAIRKALSDLAAKRKYKRLPFLILDEVFGALDKSHRDSVIGILNMLSQEFTQIIAISHTDIQSAFPDIIKAVKQSEDTVYIQ